jgi:hypothetical protein
MICGYRASMRWRGMIALLAAMSLGACGGESAEHSTSTPTATPSASPAHPVDVLVYRGDGFEFSYPASWKPQEPTLGFVAVVVGAPPADRHDGVLPNVNLVVEPLRQALTTDRYFLASRQAVAGSFTGFVLVNVGRTTIDDEPARWIEYRWTSQGTEVQQRQAYQVQGETGYVITLTTSPAAFEDHLGTQLLVERSLRVD